MKFLSILYQSSYVSSLFHFSSFKVASFSVASERRNRRSNIMDAGGGELNLNHILGTSVVNLLGMDTGDFQYDRMTEEPSGQPTEHVTEKKKGGNQKKKRPEKDMVTLSKKIRTEIIYPEKLVTAKIVKFSKEGYPVVRFTKQFSWIGLRAQVGKGLESSYENLKLGQNVRVQLTDMFQDSEDESYWLLDCKLVEQDNNQLLDETV